jgi:amino acid adenylation domain-containing protein
MQVETCLELSAARFSGRTALVCEGRRLSYEWIEEQSNRLANALIRRGIERGDRVAVCLDNSINAVLSIFAILKAGAVLVMLNPATGRERLVHILNDSGARMLLLKKSRAAELESQKAVLPSVEAVVISGEPGRLFGHDDDCIQPAKRAIDTDIAALLYTSGTTGRPKGVIMTHFNMISAATSVTEYLRLAADDVILSVLPLSSSYGLYQLLTAFKAGAALVLERSFTYPYVVLEQLSDEKVTGFAIVPTIAAVLLQLDLSKHRFTSLRYLTNAGAALPVEHVPRLRALFPSAELFLMYGLTECKRVSFLDPNQVAIRPDSVGKAMPNVEAYVVDEHGRRLPPDGTGELVVRGSNVMRGYWKQPDETERVLRPGPVPGERVLYTGDLFRMDAEGYLYFVGRRDDMIKSRGEKVSPTEVENVIYRLDDVAMAAVVGVPDPLLGSAVKAILTLREGSRLTEIDVQRHCARYLDDFMVPRLVEFRRSMPLNGAGKIDKRALTGGNSESSDCLGERVET